MTVLNPALYGGAATVATFTRNPSNPILRGVRIGSEIAAKSLDAQIVHFIPRSESPAEQLGLVDEVVRIKPDAIVFAPFDPRPWYRRSIGSTRPASRSPMSTSGSPAAIPSPMSEPTTTGLRSPLLAICINAMGQKGNVVILEGPDNLPTSIARVKAYNDVLKEYPDVMLLASKSANYARTPAADVMKSFLRLYPQIDGVLAANDPMAIGAIEAPQSRQRECAGCRNQCQQGGNRVR